VSLVLEIIADVVVAGDKSIASVMEWMKIRDTGEQLLSESTTTAGRKYTVANISANSRKNLKWPQWDTQGH
jgi:hypothetical protein